MIELKLNPEERRKLILKEIEVNGEVNINDLSKRLDVSDMTIRRDFKKLEKDEKLLKTYGGAISVSQNNSLGDALRERIMRNKEEIGRAHV